LSAHAPGAIRSNPWKGSVPEGRRTRSRFAGSEQTAKAEFISFTVEAATGALISVEAVDAAGTRQELSDDQRASLATDDTPTVESIVERAFEAGIECVLGGEAAEDKAADAEDAELRQALLRSLIARSAAKMLIQREVLRRAIIGSLMAAAASGGASQPASH